MAEKVATIGNVPIYKIDSIYLVILCTKTLNIPNVGTAIKKFREMYPKVMIQGINPNCIFGKEHIFEVMKIVLEANRREMKIAKRLEMDLLLRLICSNQVAKAIDIGGIKNNGSGCFILFSGTKYQIIKSVRYLRKTLDNHNGSLLNASREKMVNICSAMQSANMNFSTHEFLKILTEKAALVSQ
jgi:tRNA threonylcarbamoyladenosine modification (KEOPS) complex Cgi121 subunit